MANYIGTSGWSYGHWRGLFYPQELSKGRWLEFYMQHFDTVELNAVPQNHSWKMFSGGDIYLLCRGG